MYMTGDEELDWDEEVQLMVTLRVKAKKGEHFEGWEGYSGQPREPWQAASTALVTGVHDLENLDGFADLIGEVDIVYVEEW